jgi:hypothetical protein
MTQGLAAHPVSTSNLPPPGPMELNSKPNAATSQPLSGPAPYPNLAFRKVRLLPICLHNLRPILYR